MIRPWWMPDTSQGLAIGLILFFCALGGVLFFTMLPEWKEMFRAKRKKVEGDAALANALGINLEKQTDLMERQTVMLNDHGIKLNSHGEMLTVQRERLDELVQLQREKWEHRRRSGDSGSMPTRE